ncbi:glyoxalase [Flavobacterium magnum]|uniref:Glyoxalase n=1 Tax=Flavobacterium magnum TaxID=2162713 RepID=A0A2S0RJD4_9FLAO|nr:VOC family protein [Flavobacterium magnum]AWA31251.1 glyoxalase [Flavobacterium magnum]
MKKVTGIGGIFFKSKDPKAMNEWYRTHLGIEMSPWGAKFEWRDAGNPEIKGSTAWRIFDNGTDYFEPSDRDFMVNYRVQDMEAMVAQLRSAGVTILDEIVVSDFGKFVHILDAEGNKLQLCEPIG